MNALTKLKQATASLRFKSLLLKRKLQPVMGDILFATLQFLHSNRSNPLKFLFMIWFSSNVFTIVCKETNGKNYQRYNATKDLYFDLKDDNTAVSLSQSSEKDINLMRYALRINKY